jgi:hypothetical protein
MATDIKVPTLGESVTEATVAKWLKAPGDSVAVDEPTTVSRFRRANRRTSPYSSMP